MSTTQDRERELLPCPFCGGPAELDTMQGYRAFVGGAIGNRIAAYCTVCSADIGICMADVPDALPEHVVEAWNRRASLPPSGSEPSEAYVDPVNKFLTDQLRIWKDLGEPAPLNELQSIAAWLRHLGQHGAEKTKETMRTRMVILMKAANDLNAAGPEAEARAGIYDNRAALTSGSVVGEPSDVEDAARYRFWRKFYHSQFAINGKHSLKFMPTRPHVEVAGPNYESVVDAALDAALVQPSPPVQEAAGDDARDASRFRELNTPEIVDFVDAVGREALHQRHRWGADGDTPSKDPQ